MDKRTNAPGVAQPSLTGDYVSTGYTGRTLRRSDGVTLTVNDTRRPGNAARYVRVITGGRPEYGGNLYGPDGRDDAEATAELDGCEFQYYKTRIRYVIRSTGETGTYTVMPKGGAST